MSGRISALGFKMTEEQREELHNLLTEDILERYDNIEYWNLAIIEEFAHDNQLERNLK